ncbi:hypothetical protein HanRHA438_Chr10g0440831 [Helianthus annuus]|nr:hypothetical protein HanIR_Chr10g0461971 [Helianthus annuus]KAJ0878533.1 hypothetical protein HanRHA438_Chr10g0440831 [Helianthus annuus]
MSNHFLPFDIESIIDDVLPSLEDDSSSRISDETISEKQAHRDQNSSSNESVQLPKESKVWFFLSYSSFLIFYLVFVLALAFTYPLKPVFEVEYFDIPDNITEYMNSPVSVWLSFINRNPLISYSYGNINLNVNVSYYPRSRDNIVTEFNFATTTAQGYSQRHRNHTIEIKMPVTAPRGSLLKMYKETRTAFFLVNQNFSVSFKCSVSCSHKELHMSPSVWYQYLIK